MRILSLVLQSYVLKCQLTDQTTPELTMLLKQDIWKLASGVPALSTNEETIISP